MGIPIEHEATSNIVWSDRRPRYLRTAQRHTPTGQTFVSPAETGGDQAFYRFDDQLAGCPAASRARAASDGHEDAGYLRCLVTGIGASRCQTVSCVVAGCDRLQRRSSPLTRRM